MLSLGSERQGHSIVARGVDVEFTTLLRVGARGVAWDAAREPAERYRVAWSLANGRGVHKALWGRSITAVKVDPDGEYVAISETTAMRDHTSRMPSTFFAPAMARSLHRNLPTIYPQCARLSRPEFLPIPTRTERTLPCASWRYQIKKSCLPIHSWALRNSKARVIFRVLYNRMDSC